MERRGAKSAKDELDGAIKGGHEAKVAAWGYDKA